MLPYRQLEPLADKELPSHEALIPQAAETAVTATAAGVTASLGGTDIMQTEDQGPYQPKLSKHEKQLMQRAHERHQASITSKQVLLLK